MEILGVLPNILEELKKRGRILDIRGCIHVGAHEGQEYPLYKAFGINNLIFYEPLPDNFKKLQANAKSWAEEIGPKPDLRNIALGNKVGSVEMHLEERGLSSSVLEPAHHLEQYPQIEFNEQLEVPITKLDIEEFNREDFNFMNVDVQGYELEVLKGAVNTLPYMDLILAEINKEEMYKGCPLVEDVDKFLEGHGFKRIFHYWQQDGGTWGDGLYLRVNQ